MCVCVSFLTFCVCVESVPPTEHGCEHAVRELAQRRAARHEAMSADVEPHHGREGRVATAVAAASGGLGKKLTLVHGWEGDSGWFM